ncbi:MAG: thermonuclease family protein [PVC group bacterium]|nr:thermonuclease family protein [PVC group bacterium]
MIKRVVLTITFIISCVFIFFFTSGLIKKQVDYDNVLVRRVVDGDTLKLENKQRVRLLGIDTPEYHESDKLYRDSRRLKKDIKTIQKMGYASYQYTKKLVEGKRVQLEFDKQRFDTYDRLLAYVYLKDGTFLNASLVEDGYATVYIIPPNIKYEQELLKLQNEAKQQKRGLWLED